MGEDFRFEIIRHVIINEGKSILNTVSSKFLQSVKRSSLTHARNSVEEKHRDEAENR